MTDWNHVFDSDRSAAAPVDSRRRLRWLLAGFVLAVAVVMSRAVQLEVTAGAATRARVAEPLVEEIALPAARGRILARDGTVLAYDRQGSALAVQYRSLEDPPNEAWLLREAKRRLSPAQRRETAHVRAAVARLRVEQVELHRQLARLCGLSNSAWQRRRATVQERVERIARLVNDRQQRAREEDAKRRTAEEQPRAGESLFAQARRMVETALAGDRVASRAGKIVVAEELEHHVLFDALPAAAAAAIEADPARYPGVKIVAARGRVYPEAALAAHIVGHVGRGEASAGNASSAQAGDWVGRMGLELACEAELRGAPGREVREKNRSGKLLAGRVALAPQPGRDVTLTLDLPLQRSAERLLDSALAQQPAPRDDVGTGKPNGSGAALVVLDCHSGELLACASAPRFDPNDFVRANAAALGELFESPAKPLVDRAAKMAIPPGSVMKVFTAAALLESGTVDAHEPFYCQGYFDRPSELRCMLYRHSGIGHEHLTLAGALAASCNVYFFHHAPQLGGERLAEWYGRFGFGRATGVELASEAAGQVPSPANIEQLAARNWRTADTQSLAIGQSLLTVTPLQTARGIAAVANGGRLVTPHLVVRPDDRHASPAIDGLSLRTIEEIRRGMERTADDPAGTASRWLGDLPVRVAAKTGTAETGRGDHAWLAGYFPADAPQFAFVVVFEHTPEGQSPAGPVARRLIQRMAELRMVGRLVEGRR